MRQNELIEQMAALAEGVTYDMSNLANASALLYGGLEEINWVGFYLLRDRELVLGPFQGKPACTNIALGRGVCGSAAKENRTLRIEDVHRFSGHIACDAASNSEIVIPIRKNGGVWGVLDIDSPKIGRFDEEDQKMLESFVRKLEMILGFE